MGLLLIRLAVAFGGFEQVFGIVSRPDALNATSWSMAALSGLISAVLILGILTPLASCIAAVINVRDALSNLFFSHHGSASLSVEAAYIAVMSVALLLLGPGAISLDARLFGRREIIIPDDPRSSAL